MNMFKSNGGFTLVELIVVIAILAILAGVAVPAYSGYIKKAEQAADLQVLSSVNTAAQGLAIALDETVSEITVGAGETPTISVTTTANVAGATVTGVTEAQIEELTGNITFDSTFKGATWTTANGWKITE